MSRRDIDAKTFHDSYFRSGISRVYGTVIVTMPTCGKCKGILAQGAELDRIFGGGYSVYTFNGEPEGLEVLQAIGVSSAPIAVYLGPDGKDTAKHFETIKELENFANSLESTLGD